jgi:hypothetical protein
MYVCEQGRFSLNKLNKDFMAGSDTPKEIEIRCAGEPMVTIKDLVTDVGNDYEGECMVINMKGDNFEFRFALNCTDN